MGVVIQVIDGFEVVEVEDGYGKVLFIVGGVGIDFVELGEEFVVIGNLCE